MYTKDKLNRITLRLNEEQFSYVKANSDILGVSPSEFLRMVINATMSLSSGLDIQEAFEEKERIGEGRENDKTNIDDIV